jgi:hypothetical protein
MARQPLPLLGGMIESGFPSSRLPYPLHSLGVLFWWQWCIMQQILQTERDKEKP